MIRLEGPVFATVLTVATLLAACPEGPDPTLRGQGERAREARSFEPFRRIEVAVPGDVRIRVEETAPKVEVETFANLLPHLKTRVRDGTLAVFFDRPVREVDFLRLDVVLPRLEALDLQGAVRAEAHGIAGSALDLRIGGAANVVLEGQVQGLQIRASGAGHVNARDLQTRTATVELSGAGHVDVYATEALKVDVTGVGAIRYRGQPRITRSIRGVGQVEPLPAPAPEDGAPSGQAPPAGSGPAPE